LTFIKVHVTYVHAYGPQIWNSLPADLRLVDNYARLGDS